MKEKRKSMTKDEMIMELMELLKANGKSKQAADVFESAAYVDMLESKLDQMTNELVQMRKELQEMKEQQASKSLKGNLQWAEHCKNWEKQIYISIKNRMQSIP